MMHIHEWYIHSHVYAWGYHHLHVYVIYHVYRTHWGCFDPICWGLCVCLHVNHDIVSYHHLDVYVMYTVNTRRALNKWGRNALWARGNLFPRAGLWECGVCTTPHSHELACGNRLLPWKLICITYTHTERSTHGVETPSLRPPGPSHELACGKRR